jgi:IMP cyclohydrolase
MAKNIIKGPVKIGGKDGVNVRDLLKKGTIKLPFEASGWSSKENSDLINGGGSFIPTIVADVVDEVKVEKVEEKPKFKRKYTKKYGGD